MPSKKLVMVGLFIGSILGGYIPILFGASAISITAVFFSAIGGIAGIYIAYKLSSNL